MIAAFRVTGPVYKWVVSMDLVRLSVLTSETVRFPVSADADGLPYDPTGATVEMAFTDRDTADPAPGDWTAGSWDVTLIGSYVAGCLVGPTGKVLAPGVWRCWVRITDTGPGGSGETVVRQAGELIVD